MKQQIVLASSSPQRADIMRELGVEFSAVAMNVNEVVLSSADETAQANARLKAHAAHAEYPTAIIIAADTVISHNGRVLGKPSSAQEAREILLSMSGKDVKAVSAVAVIDGETGTGCVVTESAVAHLRRLSSHDIDWYVGMGEPLSRAGSLGISRYGEIFIEGIDGAYSCFAGLPKRSLLAALVRAGLGDVVFASGESKSLDALSSDLTIADLQMI